MRDPFAALQPALIAALRADGAVLVAFGADPVKIYDVAPVNAVPPYLTIDQASVVPDLADCLQLAEAEVTICAYALTDPPSLEAAAVLGQAALDVAERLATAPGFTIQQARAIRSQYMLDHDGRTAKAVIAVRFATDAQ